MKPSVNDSDELSDILGQLSENSSFDIKSVDTEQNQLIVTISPPELQNNPLPEGFKFISLRSTSPKTAKGVISFQPWVSKLNDVQQSHEGFNRVSNTCEILKHELEKNSHVTAVLEFDKKLIVNCEPDTKLEEFQPLLTYFPIIIQSFKFTETQSRYEFILQDLVRDIDITSYAKEVTNNWKQQTREQQNGYPPKCPKCGNQTEVSEKKIYVSEELLDKADLKTFMFANISYTGFFYIGDIQKSVLKHGDSDTTETHRFTPILECSSCEILFIVTNLVDERTPNLEKYELYNTNDTVFATALLPNL